MEKINVIKRVHTVHVFANVFACHFEEVIKNDKKQYLIMKWKVNCCVFSREFTQLNLTLISTPCLTLPSLSPIATPSLFADAVVALLVLDQVRTPNNIISS